MDLDGEQEAKLQAVIDRAVAIRNTNYAAPVDKLADIVGWWTKEIDAYVATFVPDAAVRNIAIATAVRVSIHDHLSSTAD